MRSKQSSTLQHPKVPESVNKVVPFVSALLLAASNESASISELVMVYRQSGLGGERACRKLIHRLERLKLLQIDVGFRDDRREKAVCLTAQARVLLGEVHGHLAKLGLTDGAGLQGSSTE